MQLLWLLYTQAKPEHSQACIFRTSGIIGNSKRIAFSKLSLSTQLDLYSPSPVNLPVSKCYAPAA